MAVDIERAEEDGVGAPTYDRKALKLAWVHFGRSNFFSAHQAYYMHRLNNVLHSKGEPGYGITVIDMFSKEIIDDLRKQDGLYTLVEIGPDEEKFHCVGSVVNHIHGSSEGDAMWALLRSSDTTIVSLTITQKGYYGINQETAKRDNRPPGLQWIIDDEDETVIADIQNPNTPKTVMGILVEALYVRYSNGIQPFTTLTCDNMPDNGIRLQGVILDLAYLQGRPAEFQAWLSKSCTFPTSMVDRITPQCTPELLEQIKNKGIVDLHPVPTEANFTKWVIQDQFCNSRPPLELVGVEFCENTETEELVKLRMLNGAHMALGIVGTLAGIEYVHEAMKNPAVRKFMSVFHTQMASSLSIQCPFLSFNKLIRTIHYRFSNPAIKDTLIRLTRDITNKLNGRLLTPIRDVFESSGKYEAQQVSHLCFTLAAWMHFVKGVDWEVADAEVEIVQNLAKENDPMAFLRQDWFGDDLVNNKSFVKLVTDAYYLIEKEGIKGALEKFTSEFV